MPEVQPSSRRPFRFLASWVEHMGFSEFVKENWKFMGDMSINHATFTDQVILWNNEVYDYITHRKNLLKKKLDNVQKAIDRRSSTFLNQVELEIREELESVLHHKELLWRRTLQGRKHNRIMALKNQAGEWVMDEDELKNLYGEKSRKTDSLGCGAFQSLEQEEIQFLSMLVFYEEIKKAFFDMAPLKAPDNDGLHAIFYQRPEQAGFVVGRNINDNIIIAQEVIHSMKSKQKNKRWMAIKIDLEKAYDLFIGISWTLLYMLQVLWNGVPSQKFKPARGVRQGCPLSPYLFILCMGWLGHGTHTAMAEDDLIIFGQAEEEHARVIKEVLDTFCGVSSHNVNLQKSNMFFSKGVDEDIQRRVLLFHEKVTNNTLHFVIDKVRSKLCSWDARQLSLVGRITLAQAVLLSISSYFMQSMMIPKGLCDEIEAMVRQFIWGSTSSNKNIPLVSWDLMCQPKSHGGLGIRSLRDQNTSFIMKLGFKLMTGHSSFGVNVLRGLSMGFKVDYQSLYRVDSVLSCGDLYRRFGRSYGRICSGILEMGAILTAGRILGFLMLGRYPKR
ncbi:reverse transcriptase [Gossypium australe]|uniref:Reverse transcriptase n=1 Tax=Gossypium australe TaxID=47621 RepID=A0A5B6V040_9ROSI|nr:reverse transcriptase [Gossypium australe]